MAIDIDLAATKALEELNEMSVTELLSEVKSNINDPLSVAIRELISLREDEYSQIENQTYSYVKSGLTYASLNETSYKTVKAANVEQYIPLAS